MKKQILSSALLLPFFCHLTYAQNIEIFEPTFPKFSTNSTERKQSNQLYAVGQATFNNNVKVPMYGVTVPHPIDEGLLKPTQACNKSSCTFNFKIDAQDAEKLKLIELPSIGLTLVPRDWNNIQAAAGANGTGSALIMNSAQNEALSMYNSSFCVGCGLPYATLYFPQLLKESVQSEFGGYIDKNKKINIVYPSQHVAFFSYQIPKTNNKTHGIAKYNDDNSNFQNIKITLDKSNQNLATPILNFYHLTH